MAIPAGSRGGYFHPLRDTGLDLASFIEALPEIYRDQDLHCVKTLGWYVNSVCNLACAHCYYSTPEAYRSPGGLDTASFLSSIDEGLKTSAVLFAFVGKETFLPGTHGAEKTIAGIKRVAAARSETKHLRVGAVTNGVLLHRFLDQLSDTELDFLDISIDGADARSHDALRGPGSFDRSIANVRRAVDANVAGKLFVASTLTKANIGNLLDVLDLHSTHGPRHFSITPIVAVQDEGLSLSLGDLVRFFEEQVPRKAASVPAGESLQLVADVDSYVVFQAVDQFSRLMDGATVEIDQLNNILLRRQFAGIELVLRVSLPDPCNSYGCVTHDGLYFDKGGCLFMKSGYERHAAGSVETTELLELVAKHERIAHSLPRLIGREVFGRSSHRVLTTLESTDFYWTPEIA